MNMSSFHPVEIVGRAARHNFKWVNIEYINLAMRGNLIDPEKEHIVPVSSTDKVKMSDANKLR